MKKKICAPKPWTDLKVVGLEDKIDIYVSDRVYSFDHTLLFSQIASKDYKMLKEPIRVNINENHTDFTYSNAKCFVLKYDAKQVTIVSTAQSSKFIINTCVTIDYDGYAKVDLKVCPVGYTVNQMFGVDKNTDKDFLLEKLNIEVVLNDNIMNNYHFYPLFWKTQMPEYKENPVEFSKVAMSRKIPSTMSMEFKPVVFFGNDEIGLSIQGDSDENWQPEEKKAYEFIKGDTDMFRINLLASHPKKWDFHRENPNLLQQFSFVPLSFVFSMQATPVKPNDDVIYNYKSLHIDCFKKIKEDYYEFLLEKSIDSNYKCNLDYIKAMGVNLLYLHEKWNPIQNYFEIPVKRANEIKQIIKECHKRGIKVIPYFGYEISTLSPIFTDLGLKTMQNVKGYYPNGGGWYRVPYQRCVIECLHNEFKDLMLDGFEKFYNEFDFDGIYLDSTLYPQGCLGDHGCGYVDADGNKRVTYPTSDILDYIRKIYEIVKKHNGIVSIHTSNCINASAMAYADVIWDGEAIQQYIHENGVDSIPKDYLDAELCKDALGMNFEFLIYTFDNWTFKQGLSLCLPMGILPKPNDIEEPLKIMNEIWNIYDSFGVKDSVIVKKLNDSLINLSNDEHACYYEKVDKGLNKLLLIVGNPSSKELLEEVKLNLNKIQAIDMFTGEVISNNNNFNVNLNSCETKIILIKEI